MEAFLVSFPLVTLAEMGDKTQLLTLLLAARYRCFWPIFWGMLLATLLNHGLSAWAGEALGGVTQQSYVQWGASLLFIAVGIWALVPDEAGGLPERVAKYGAFGATLIAFFIAEIGDKTQLATVTLAAHYHDVIWVMLGTTAGMLMANIPAILLGETLLARIPMARMRQLAACAFLLLGLAGIYPLL